MATLHDCKPCRGHASSHTTAVSALCSSYADVGRAVGTVASQHARQGRSCECGCTSSDFSRDRSQRQGHACVHAAEDGQMCAEMTQEITRIEFDHLYQVCSHVICWHQMMSGSSTEH